MAYGTRYSRGRTQRYGFAVTSVALWLSASGLASCGGEDFVANTDLPDSSAEAGGAAGTGGSAGKGGAAGGAAGDASIDKADAGAAGTKPEAGKDVDADAGCTKDEKLCDNKCALLTAPETGCGKVSCDACAFTHASAKCATDGSCAMDKCDTGFDNCDKDATNGCEGNLDNDPKNCKTCGNICTATGGTPTCEKGVCGFSVCDPGKGDCDGDKTNGCETDTNTSVANCGFCKNACLLSYATPKCDAGTCKVDKCDPGRGNCDTNDSNGCEVDTDTETANCGTCGNVCPTLPNSTPLCAAGKCSFTCTGGYADCDADTTNGCETDLTSTTNHCGTCPTICTAANGTPKCEASVCKIAGCNTGFADCDSQVANGCEADLASLQHCGTCLNNCPLPANATASCTSGTCGFACNAGFDNCDGDSLNGCEANLMSDVQHCSVCATVCALPNATQACVAGACQIAACTAGWGDCNGAAVDGCEVDITSSVAHCGSCPNACALPNANPVCTSGSCQVGSCIGAFANCDAQPANGCEVNLNTSMTNCGTCNKLCDLSHASEQCTGGVCQITTCDAPYLNCDGQDTTGCEVNSTNDSAHCGNCSTACTMPHATGVCANSVCAIGSCDTGYGNCDGVIGNGCETNTNTSTAHCGGCFNPCSFSNASATCVGGTCNLGTCNAGFGNCDNNPVNGCEAQFVLDPANCGACGHSCLGGTCTGGKCDPITLAPGTNPWGIATDGAFVYWGNRASPGGTIQRVPVGGGAPFTIASNQSNPEGLALNSASVAWANYGDGKIQLAPLAGGGTTTLTTVAAGGPTGIAATDTHVYFTNWTLNTIQRVTVAPAAPQTLSLAAGNSNPHRIATNGVNVWWASMSNGAVRRAPAVPGATSDVATAQNGPIGIAIDAANVYWTNQAAGTVSWSPALGNTASVLVSGQDNPTGIAVDASHVYWVNNGGSGTVRRVPKGGGAVETLTSLQQGPLFIALDATAVYWTNNTGGTVMRIAK